MEDKRLLRLIKKARFGDKDAFCELINEKSRKILFIATNLMGNSADGEDAAQEAVITLARKIGTLKKAELFDAWMYRIVYNVCMDEKRRRKVRKLDESAELDTAIATVPESNAEVIPEKNLDNAIQKEAIMDALNTLPERYRMCMLLYYYEDMSYAEIAETLQVSEQVVANTLNRAKEKLRVSLNDMATSDTSSGLAVKAGAFLPAAAITQAITHSEATTILPSAAASLTAVAAGVTMPKGLVFLHFIDSIAGKAITGVACAAIFAGVVNFGMNVEQDVIPEPEPPAIVESNYVPEQEVAPELPPAVFSAKINGLPEDAVTTMYVEGYDDEALAAFNAEIENYSFITSARSEGYVFTVYGNINDPMSYIVTVYKDNEAL